MAEATGNQESKDYGIGIPAVNTVYKLKGSNNYDWGMKDRLSRVFSPKSGKTVMLAFDHGYIMGPTSGLERIDITILPPFLELLVIILYQGLYLKRWFLQRKPHNDDTLELISG